jgi:hypothetical protein
VFQENSFLPPPPQQPHLSISAVSSPTRISISRCKVHFQFCSTPGRVTLSLSLSLSPTPYSILDPVSHKYFLNVSLQSVSWRQSDFISLTPKSLKLTSEPTAHTTSMLSLTAGTHTHTHTGTQALCRLSTVSPTPDIKRDCLGLPVKRQLSNTMHALRWRL